MPSSPNLNAANCRIWGVMQDREYQTQTQDVADLKRFLVDTWRGFSQSIVDDDIDEWCKRLQA